MLGQPLYCVEPQRWRGFRVNGKSFPGLTARLKQFAAPHHDWRRCNQGRRERAPPRPPRFRMPTAAGSRYGSVIHAQLERITHLLTEYDVRLLDFCKLHKRVVRKSPRTKAWFDAAYPDAPPQAYTRLRRYVKGTLRSATAALCRFMARKGWEPIASEVPCVDPRIGVATAADLVVRDASSRRLRVLEIKTGYAHKYFMHTGHALARPWHSQKDSAYALHQLQLRYTEALMRTTFPEAHWSTGYVIRVNASHGVTGFMRKSWASPLRALPRARR